MNQTCKQNSFRYKITQLLAFLPKQVGLWLCAIVAMLLCWAAGQPLNQLEPIALVAEPMPFTPKEFYIADVVDERKDRKAVAYLFPETVGTDKPGATQAIDLKGGTIAGLKQYLNKSLPQNTKLRPVIIRLKELKVTESAGATGTVEGKVSVVMEFDLKRDGETVQLLQYKGGAKYGRSPRKQTAVEPALRQSLVNALKYLNTWMDKEADVNEKLAREVRVFISDHVAQNADTVFYNASRPLTWNDFRGSPSKPSSFAASVFPSFGYESRFEVEKGIINIYLTMRVFMVKDYSWVRAGKDPYGLNHEQRHFDIVKLVSERYKQKVQPENLTVADYNSIMQYQYIESFREMNRMQEQYDMETRHGLDRLAQERWNQKIDEELRAFDKKASK
ncbi:hypothetical protein [Pontibacter sp. SGAir0037]|uniref:hypothetical protein n=1 Tax=Pontibacter sp. SGAir0037 TaxID=2571030 RepID=UPI0010CCE6B6|nr:hypothetical protein [Pontibacter sp. SGAir0037]QCR22731.1 hypothetical protein C1N53_10495 [Pontibacter sp. SGAir0037]